MNLRPGAHAKRRGLWSHGRAWPRIWPHKILILSDLMFGCLDELYRGKSTVTGKAGSATTEAPEIAGARPRVDHLAIFGLALWTRRL
jgi:hypothetical protein